MAGISENDRCLIMSKILIIGSLAEEKWIGHLIYRVKQMDPSIIIDFFWNDYESAQPCENSKYCERIYNINQCFPSFLYKNRKIRGFLKRRDLTISFNKFITESIGGGIHYDCVNFHYLRNETLCCWKGIRKLTDRTLLMPWGSDVLRRSCSYLKRMRKYIQHYDYVGTSDNPRFKMELKEKLAVRDDQFVDLDFGAESIDRLIDNRHVSREMAKKALGLNGKYIITVGYNSHEEQHHIEVIDALSSIKEKLPSNTLLVFPMTYGGKQQVRIVEQKVKQAEFDYKIYDQYLSYDDIVNLRKCSDMFIHAQTTDSNSASLAEYLFCRATVINASWLKYEHFEQFGTPYYVFDDFNHLQDVIEEALNGGSRVCDDLVSALETYSWAHKTPKWLAIFNGDKNNFQ